jgi:mRNA-degrading endonuclease RelE of RelBE toxin-antitoxin system
MQFTLEITEEALEDLEYFDKAAQVTIFDEIERQLAYQPLQETKNRKPLRPGSQFQWELRIGKYRIFYDVIEETEETSLVSVVSVGYKEHNKLYIRDQEVNL